MRVDYCAFTDTGLKRQINQDNYIVETGRNPKLHLFAVADGMGGHSHGEKASRAIVGQIHRWAEEADFDDAAESSVVAESLKNVVLRANKLIYERTGQREVCGSTLALLCIWKSFFIVVSVGDSRIYRCSRKGGVVQITKDDVWEAQHNVIQAYMPQEMAKHADYGKLLMAVGVFRDLPVTYNIDILERRNNFLLCSDGVYKYCNKNDIKSCLTLAVPSRGEKRLQRLKEKVFSNGAGDNLTAILVSCRP